jgi:hypothetical protein
MNLFLSSLPPFPQYSCQTCLENTRIIKKMFLPTPPISKTPTVNVLIFFGHFQAQLWVSHVGILRSPFALTVSPISVWCCGNNQGLHDKLPVSSVTSRKLPFWILESSSAQWVQWWWMCYLTVLQSQIMQEKCDRCSSNVWGQDWWEWSREN